MNFWYLLDGNFVLYKKIWNQGQMIDKKVEFNCVDLEYKTLLFPSKSHVITFYSCLWMVKSPIQTHF